MAASDSEICKYVWMDGEMVAYADAKVPVLSHSFHYGGAVWEGIRAYETEQGKAAIFRAEDHFIRLHDSLRGLGYIVPYSVEQFIQSTRECIEKNELTNCYIRPIVYLDDSFRGLQLPDLPKPRTAIAAWNWGRYMGEEAQKSGIRTTISSYRRGDVSTSLPLAKISGGYVTSVLARREASRYGLEEAILLDPQGYVAEGPGENIFLVKNGIIITPPQGNILPGITRNTIFHLAKDLGFEIREEAMTRNQLYLADELFFAGTAVEITPIREVDGHPIGSGTRGPVTEKINLEYHKCVEGKNPKFSKWLTLV